MSSDPKPVIVPEYQFIAPVTVRLAPPPLIVPPFSTVAKLNDWPGKLIVPPLFRSLPRSVTGAVKVRVPPYTQVLAETS